MILEVKNLNHTYMPDTVFSKKALKDINFSIEKGEFIGLIGHSGSGKSTLIQHLNGLLSPESGEVLLNGVNIFSDKKNLREARCRVGLVFQYPEQQLFEETVFKDIAFGPSNMGLSKDEIERRVRNAAELVGVPEDLFEKSPFELSGGQKRRVAIAGILAMEPKLLILDEPTAGLDPQGREEILSRISELHKRLGITVVFVSHSMENIASMADTIVVMNQGKVEMQGTPDEIFKRADRLNEIGLSVPQITEVCDRLRKEGFPLSEGIYTIEKAKAEIEKILKNS